MAVLQVHGLGVAFVASVPVLSEVDFTLDAGSYGLVGANGAGKTTLLAILAGALTPDEGTVVLRPRDAVVAYCPQRVEACTPDVAALAHALDPLACELRGRLSLEPGELDRWPTLSPGERKRWQIAAALAREPDVLLLDEPTNHLDAEARSQLVDALRRFDGLMVIVSHDRAVLDELTTSTLRVHDAKVTLYPGPYGRARSLWQAERAQQEAAHGAARDRVRRIEKRLDVARRTQASAERSVSARHRMKDANDSDARGMLATTRAGWAEGRAGRSVELVRAELDRARGAVPTIERDATLGSEVFAQWERASTPILMHLERDAVKAGEHVVLRDVRVSVGRQDRVHIVGANGAGKTTLLEALVGTAHRPERLLYLPQELARDAVAALWRRLAESPSAERGRTMSIFAALGSDPARVLRGDPSGASPGEARKLMLAEALSHQVWALVLDEPTNHLDLPSIERLEHALTLYPGAIVLVTHDGGLARKVTTRAIRVADGRAT